MLCVSVAISATANRGNEMKAPVAFRTPQVFESKTDCGRTTSNVSVYAPEVCECWFCCFTDYDSMKQFSFQFISIDNLIKQMPTFLELVGLTRFEVATFSEWFDKLAGLDK